MRKVSFGDFQFVETIDLNNMGNFAQEGLDALGAMAVGRGRGWEGFNVLQDTSSSVNVVVGRIILDGIMYGLPDLALTPVDLLAVSPTSSKKIITIVATGAEVPTGAEPRSFEDETTKEAISKSHFTEKRRKIGIGLVAGEEAPTPMRPALLPSYTAIAYVTMQVGAGVVAIEMAYDFQVKSLQAQEARLKAAEGTLAAAGTQLETLGTTIANTQQSISRMNVPLINQIARFVAELRDMFGRSSDGLLDGYERFMTLTGTDEAAVGYKARVEEGLRFPWAATIEITPQLLNPGNGRTMTLSGWTLPRFTKSLRLNIWRQDISVNVADYNYSNVSATVYPGAKTRRRSGPSMIVSENSQLWQDGRYTYNYLTQTFKVGTENWVVTDEWVQDGVTYRRVEQFFSDKIPYWNGYRSMTDAVSGNLLAQTFLNAQPGWLLELGLRFSKVTADDLKVYLTGLTGGQPSFDKTYSQGLISDAVASAGDGTDGHENKAVMQPIFMQTGEKYALQLSTAGDYAVACRADNYLTLGSLHNGDGLGYIADLGKDMCMRQYFAQFDNNYVEVELQSLTLSGGITDIDIISEEYVPEGSQLIFRYGIGGAWHEIDKTSGTHPLAVLPPTIVFGALMVGTRDAMPGINLANTRVRLSRADDDFVWQSKVKNCGTPAATVEMIVVLRNWKPAKHTLTSSVLSGANTDAPDATTDTTLADGRVERRMTFGLVAPSATFAMKLVGATTDAADGFVVESVYYNAL
ncbi:hypothetical protein [Shinella sp. JR1-6]|uniref:hypothetical protein n=1 Tax=Shinella sp. JR1-6 TaxID=2527671 RepID=UPI00102D3F28|nr:hypothetical protein [Shinella sp. JR1-6]TAA54636.1 hypothetical protein EXZ48_26795 [Shinella sp. JR1-6]